MEQVAHHFHHMCEPPGPHLLQAALHTATNAAKSFFNRPPYVLKRIGIIISSARLKIRYSSIQLHANSQFSSSWHFTCNMLLK